MKGIIKLFPAALAVFALASCSNEDFFGSDVKQTQKLVTTFEDTNSEDATRAAWVNNGGKTIDGIWEKGDLFRVYDAALQKYDEYECNGTDIALKGTAATTHAKAIFPGDFVYYAGYDKANDDVVAVMEIPSSKSFNVDGTAAMVENAGKVGYVSLLPQWGDAKNETEDKLEVDLKWLTGIAKVTVYKGGAQKIRIVAAASDAAAVQTAIDGAANNVALKALPAGNLDTTTPLAGYFEAQLKTDGVLKKTNNALVAATDKATSYIEVDLNGNNADSIHVYLPIIPATYKYLKIQKYNGAAWSDIKAYKDQKINRGTLVMNGLTCGDKPISAKASSLAELNTVLGVINTNANYTGKPVNIELTGEGNSVATIDDADAAKQTLTIPAFGANQILSIKGTIKNVAPNRPLKIVNNATAGTVTLTLNVEGTENVEIQNNAAGALQLTGSIASSGADVVNHGTIKVNGTAAGALTLGNGEFGSFTTAMPIVVSATGALNINAGEGTIANLSNTAAAIGAITITSGKVTKLASASTSTIAVNGGEVTTIEQTANGNVTIGAAKVGTLEAKPATGDLTFTTTVTKGAEITDLKLAKSTGDVSITDAAVASLDTKAAGANAVKIISTDANATVTTLKLNDIATVTLTGDIAGDEIYTAKIGTLDANTKKATVQSSGKSVISTASKLGAGSSFNSTWDATKIATSDITDGAIFTAAQLAGIKANTAYTLQADITIGAAWTPVNLSGNFTADSRKIDGLNAPLFNKISGTATIKGVAKDKFLALDNVAITGAAKENNLGALAKEVDGTVTVQFLKVLDAAPTAITGDATSENVGGLIGKTSGTVTLSDVQIADATLTGHANVGGFIGNVAGGTVNILTSEEWTSKIKFAEAGTYTAPDAKAGTFGNFIGSITGTGVTVDIHSTKSGTINKIANFVDVTTTGYGIRNTGTLLAPVVAPALNFAKNTSGTKVYKGMYKVVSDQQLTYEIGYSTGTITKVVLYNKTKDDLNNPYTLKLTDINVFE